MEALASLMSLMGLCHEFAGPHGGTQLYWR